LKTLECATCICTPKNPPDEMPATKICCGETWYDPRRTMAGAGVVPTAGGGGVVGPGAGDAVGVGVAGGGVCPGAGVGCPGPAPGNCAPGAYVALVTGATAVDPPLQAANETAAAMLSP
jgi:hypothetical protein